MNQDNFPALFRRLTHLPDAVALLRGSAAYPTISGTAKFFETPFGVLVSTEAVGLPPADGPCGSRIFALHIHEGGACTGNGADPFADAGGHYNPKNFPHPYHAGDLPPLFSTAGGRALSVCLTDRFTVEEIIGRTVILHGSPDDFTTQPAGNAGERIACGRILAVRR